MANISSNGTGAWATGGTWVGGVSPVAGDNVTIDPGHIVTIGAAAACDTLTINGNGGLTFTTLNLTVTGDVTISSTANLTGGTTGTLVITDSITLTSGVTIPFRINFATASKTLTLGSNFTVSGLVALGNNSTCIIAGAYTLTCSGGITITLAQKVSVSTGCTISVTGGTLTGGTAGSGNGMIGAGTLSIDGNVTFTNWNFGGIAITYNSGTTTGSVNFGNSTTITGSGTLILTSITGIASLSHTLTLNGVNLSVTTMTLASGESWTMAGNGNYIVTTLSGPNSGTAAGTLVYGGSGTLTVTNIANGVSGSNTVLQLSGAFGTLTVTNVTLSSISGLKWDITTTIVVTGIFKVIGAQTAITCPIGARTGTTPVSLNLSSASAVECTYAAFSYCTVTPRTGNTYVVNGFGTHANTTGVLSTSDIHTTDPGIANVAIGTPYTILGTPLTGTKQVITSYGAAS
jgi:hypothetical protein